MSVAAVPRARPPLSQADWVQAWPIYPLLLFLFAAFLYPVSQLLWLSLFGGTGHLTTEHYQRLFRVPVYFTVLRNTLEIAGWTTVLCIVGGYPITYFLATATARSRNKLILWVLLPFWTSFLVRTFAWMILLGRNGAVNRLLLALGITDAPISLIFNFTGVMIGMVHAMLPLGIMAMLSVMQGLDTNLVKAARSLGAPP